MTVARPILKMKLIIPIYKHCRPRVHPDSGGLCARRARLCFGRAIDLRLRAQGNHISRFDYNIIDLQHISNRFKRYSHIRLPLMSLILKSGWPPPRELRELREKLFDIFQSGKTQGKWKNPLNLRENSGNLYLWKFPEFPWVILLKCPKYCRRNFYRIVHIMKNSFAPSALT